MNYKENISGSVEHRETYKKQTGGRGKFADIIFKLNQMMIKRILVLFSDNKIKGGNIPREFIPLS